MKTQKEIEREVLDNPNYLIELREKWEKDPDSYREEVFLNLAKISNYVLSKSPPSRYYNCYLHALEEYADFQQDLIEFLYKKWSKVKTDVTNKQVFNYIYSQVYYYILTRKRDTQRNLNKEFIKTSVRPPSSESFDVMIIPDEELEEFAHAILRRTDEMKSPRKINIMDQLALQKELGLTRQQFLSLFERLREYYKED